MAITKARQLAELIANSLVDSDEISVGAVTTSKLADTLDFSSKTMVMADDQLSGDKIHGGTVSAFSSTGIDDNASSTAVTILSDGKVGIGYTSPNEKLHVNGHIEASSGFKLASHPVLDYTGFDGGYATRLGSTGTSTLNATQIFAGGSVQATFKGGKVGINTTTPRTNLAIQVSSTGSPVEALNLHNPSLSNGSGTQITFSGYSAESSFPTWRYAGISGVYDTTSSGLNSGSWGGQLRFFVNRGGAAAQFENVMTLTGGANVGIGTNSPEAKLHVSGEVLAGVADTANSAYYGLLAHRALGSGLGGYGMHFESGFENPIIWGYNNGDNGGKIRFATMTSSSDRTLGNGLTDRMVIETGTGNVGIGTSSPDSKLVVGNNSTYHTLKVQGINANLAATLKFKHHGGGGRTGVTPEWNISRGSDQTSFNNGVTAGNATVGGLAFWHNTVGGGNVDALRLKDDGNAIFGYSVGIGSTNPIGSAQRLYIDHPAGYQTSLPTVKIRRANNVGGGSAIPEIALDVSVPSTYNNATEVYGIKTYAAHNLTGTGCFAIYAEVERGNSDNHHAGFFRGGHSDTNGISKPKVVYIDQTTNVGASNTGYSIGCYIKQDDYTKNEFMWWDTDYSGTQTMNALRIFRNGSQIGGITTTTSSTSYNTSSDYRLKENVTDVTDGITRLKQLAPKRFNFIAEPDTTVDGFIAHEAQAVVPEAVTGTQDALDVEGNPDYQGIDQSKLVPLLTAALQEAIAKIEDLETEMVSVKSRIEALEG